MQYETRHADNCCPFKMRCNYFQLLQSVDKNINSSDKLVHLGSKGSLMKMKRYLSRFKPDYEIWFWVKSFKSTCSQEYKNETELIKEFKRYVNRKGKKKKNRQTASEIENIANTRLKEIKKPEEYKLQSPEYHPESPIYIPESPSAQSKTE